MLDRLWALQRATNDLLAEAGELWSSAGVIREVLCRDRGVSPGRADSQAGCARDQVFSLMEALEAAGQEAARSMQAIRATGAVG